MTCFMSWLDGTAVCSSVSYEFQSTPVLLCGLDNHVAFYVMPLCKGSASTCTDRVNPAERACYNNIPIRTNSFH